MKKILIYISSILTLLIISILIYKINTKLIYKNSLARRLKNLPSFSVKGVLSDSIIMLSSFKSNRLLIIYFNSECEHCQFEIEQLKKHINYFKSSQILLLSSEPSSTIYKFIKIQNLHIYKNIQVAHIDGKVAYETLGFSSVPHILIYGENGLLEKNYKGETKIESLLSK